MTFAQAVQLLKGCQLVKQGLLSIVCVENLSCLPLGKFSIRFILILPSPHVILICSYSTRNPTVVPETFEISTLNVLASCVY